MNLQSYWIFLEDRDATFTFGKKLGEALLSCQDCPRLLAAFGDLGAGKTSLAQGIARGVGVPDSVYVNSPTFAIHQAHQAHQSSGCITYFHHLDLYRLGDEDDLVHLGLEELIDTGISYVEWPQRAPYFFRAHPHIQIHLAHLDEWSYCELEKLEDGRVLVIKAKAEALAELLPLISQDFNLQAMT